MRALRRLLFAAFLLALILTAGAAAFALRPIDLTSERVEFTVRPGPMKSVARQINESGVPVSAWALTWLARLTGEASKVKAGSYQIERGITPYALINKLTRGDVTQAEITFIEGWTFRQMRAALNAHPDLIHDTAALTDREVLARLGVAESAAEGLFFPNTYLFAKQSSDLEVLKRSFEAMQRALNKEWEAREASLPLRTPYEALTLASIVEKETGRAEDRSLVASVFINRLRRGMLLQTDPTVIYGMGELFKGDIRKRDLLTDTPYNTYTRAGLPPTPIAMPGLASIRAALNPARSDFLYFVARGDGSSEFSRNLDDHNRAVARFILKKSQP
ncbi:MAG: hypothetical protein RIR70_1608 [Pseudomonadota bacterium]|jgi:UPF0755 protein